MPSTVQMRERRKALLHLIMNTRRPQYCLQGEMISAWYFRNYLYWEGVIPWWGLCIIYRATLNSTSDITALINFSSPQYNPRASFKVADESQKNMFLHSHVSQLLTLCSGFMVSYVGPSPRYYGSPGMPSRSCTPAASMAGSTSLIYTRGIYST